MKKPQKDCLSAVKTLTRHHRDDCATYYSLDGHNAVLVLCDPEIAHKMVALLTLMIDNLDDEDGIVEVDGVQVWMPDKPIEA